MIDKKFYESKTLKELEELKKTCEERLKTIDAVIKDSKTTICDEVARGN